MRQSDGRTRIGKIATLITIASAVFVIIALIANAATRRRMTAKGCFCRAPEPSPNRITLNSSHRMELIRFINPDLL